MMHWAPSLVDGSAMAKSQRVNWGPKISPSMQKAKYAATRALHELYPSPLTPEPPVLIQSHYPSARPQTSRDNGHHGRKREATRASTRGNARGNARAAARGSGQGLRPGPAAKGSGQGQRPGATARGNGQGRRPGATARSNSQGRRPGARARGNACATDFGPATLTSTPGATQGATQGGDARRNARGHARGNARATVLGPTRFLVLNQYRQDPIKRSLFGE